MASNVCFIHFAVTLVLIAFSEKSFHQYNAKGIRFLHILIDTLSRQQVA